MSIFEDLIEELKDENLLEETVIEVHQQKSAVVKQPTAQPAAQGFQTLIGSEQNGQQSKISSLTNDNFVWQPEGASAEQVVPAEMVESTGKPIVPEYADVVPAETKKYPEVEKITNSVSDKEYFRKRAMEEVTGLQMVDHVISSVEREQMKLVPQPYDDLPVKLALHDFLQVAHDTNTTEHAQSEFRLMQETENWCSALSHRDKHISIAHLRRYCETTKPALSSQALIALARFYRNSPYSEAVRSKFELVITRLFSRENEVDQRELLLSREEMIRQLKELYSDWSSIQLYSSDEKDREILDAVANFENFINEADSTQSFDELISSDFFNRLRLFKQSCNENFFAPRIAVSAIQANIQIGNRYLELLKREKEKFNAAALEEKYGFLHDQAISDATGKTFQLIETLNGRIAKNDEPEEIGEPKVNEKDTKRAEKVGKKTRNKFFALNKWLLAATILTIVICGALYFWAESETQELKPSPSVKKVNLENSQFKDFIQTARISNDTFFGITTNAWENLNSEKKEEMLKKLLSVGAERQYQKVHLIDGNGKAVGYASEEKTEVYNQ